MRKFLAVVKHEYRKIVMRWTFLLGTFLFPVLGIGFGVVPALIFTLKGEATRIAIVDPTGEILPRLKEGLSQEAQEKRIREAVNASSVRDISATQDQRMKTNAKGLSADFVIVDYSAKGKGADQVREELLDKIKEDEIDAYLIIPKDIGAKDATFEFRSRRGADFVANDALKNALNQAVRSKRLSDARISEAEVRTLSEDVDIDSKGLDESGNEKDSDMIMAASFVIGLMIYLTLVIYGQVVLGAVVEEKDTRIAEILFSSAKPFELMLGKLVGVGLAGLTQLGIWVVTLGSVIAYLSTQSGAIETFKSLPNISPLMIFYFLAYFLIGYFLYASIYALVGSMVTTTQEGGQFSLPATLLLVMAYLFSMVVMRDPNSPLAFWVSIAPFFAPVTMPVRILAEMPPLWQILLSMLVNITAIVGMVWLAARVYRTGMLMYGKRATIPEIWKWIRQA